MLLARVTDRLKFFRRTGMSDRTPAFSGRLQNGQHIHTF
jgi:hypothetical protein